MIEMRNAYNTSVGRFTVSPRRRWEDNTRMDLGEE
jgi:hypothetical protein